MKQKGGKKLRRSSKDVNYYATQRFVTERHKTQRKAKTNSKKNQWIGRIYKKNGERVIL